MKNCNLSAFVLVSLLSWNAYAFVEENDLDGLGLEILMGGVGQARIGSHGALGSNPSLLAWLPRNQKFVSANQINFYQLKSLDNGDADVSPDVIPRYAATTEGFGKWGHSYGLIVDNAKIAFSQDESLQTVSGIQENQGINFNYSLGYKLSEDLAFGVGIYVSRFQEENYFSLRNSSPGTQYVVSIDQKKSIFVQGISLGGSFKLDSWAFGLSTKMTTATYMAKSTMSQSGYYEETNSVITSKNENVPPVDMIPNFRAGVKKEFDNLDLYLDLSWLPPKYSSDMEKDVSSQFAVGLAAEGAWTERYGWYSGYVHRTGGIDDTADGTISIGASKKNTHSMNFAGVSWRKEFRDLGNEVIQINFGTMFDY